MNPTRYWISFVGLVLLLIYLFRFEYIPVAPRWVYRINRITGHIDILNGPLVVPMRTEGGGKSKPSSDEQPTDKEKGIPLPPGWK